MTVYNPQKGRLETILLDITTDNTTWFENCDGLGEIAMITDFNGDLVITGTGRDYPVRIYSASRILVGYDQKRVKAMQRKALK